MTNQTLKNQFLEDLYASFSIDDVMQQVDCVIENVFSKQDALQQDNNICIDALKYHFESPGQKFRAKLCLSACMKLGINYDDMLILAATSELLHNASLIHDDIQDEDEVRRGKPTVWKKYGVNIGICAGDFLISAAYGVLAAYSHTTNLPQLISTINNRTKSAIKGQSLDIFFKNKQKISIEQYISIAKQKSGALLSLPIELALVAAGRNDCAELAQLACANFAVGYQVADDLEDVTKDYGNNSVCQSVNITFVLKELDFEDLQLNAVMMCNQYLEQAIHYALQLPNGSGDFLVSLATKLKAKQSLAYT